MSIRPRHVVGFLRNKTPGQLIIQISDKCNASCPQCGMRVSNRYPRTTLGEDDIKRTIDAAAERGVEALSFTGGEPLMFTEELLRLITYAGKAGIKYLRTGTNGYVFARNGADFETRIRTFAEKLAATPIRNFWISIDSADPTVHEEMRGFPGVIEGIRRALPYFHEVGVYPTANLGINRNVGGAETYDLKPDSDEPSESYLTDFEEKTRKAFHRFYQFVIDMGFTIVNTCYPMSVENQNPQDGLRPVYAASAAEHIVKFTRAEKSVLFRVLSEVIGSYRSSIRVFSPRSSLLSLVRQYADKGGSPFPCRGGIDYFFVDSKDGNAYPCGFRGHESMGKFWALDQEKIDQNRKEPCTRCDWECFRDPSELFGPVLEGFLAPMRFLHRMRNDKEFFRLWREDLSYYRACEYFDGRRPIRRERLKTFTSSSPEDLNQVRLESTLIRS